jgi:MtN3 and saliva related transmembrane protein
MSALTRLVPDARFRGAGPWKSRSTTDISLGMFLILCLGIVLWLVYGGIRGDVPLIVANLVTLVLAGLILLLKLKHG